ncbi:MAG TPA: TIM barrel protein [Candidatus Saccharicenans sp.]|nr:TIM barrel protein [Candidatus Saccharicenans sp.]HRD02102.1 TIM barrel protein [Candidatus Saccharicenans sp.]
MTPVSDDVHFGVAGIPHTCSGNSFLKAISCLASLDLDALELAFVHGLNLSQETAGQLKMEASQHGVKLSAHAPYFINLNAEDQGQKMRSQELLLNSLRLAAAAGASDLVFHAGYYGRKTPGDTYSQIKDSLKDILSISRLERIPVRLRIETMGKRQQFGSLDEVLLLCRELDGLLPCLDFAHILAREGKINSYRDFCQVLKKVEKKLGPRALSKAHIHISGVIFNQRGEIKHINLDESEFCYDEWLQAIIETGLKGTIIVESPSLEVDALRLKGLYHNLKEKGTCTGLGRDNHDFLDTE